ncbi:MAG: nucleotidyltransferase domain-containing protein [Candidatus Sericytochromatia bacterium]
MEPLAYPSRFTVCGSRLLDERIKHELRQIVNYLRDHPQPAPLSAIWLGGSYGRGEGAVYRYGETETPWFDYDIYLLYTHSPSETEWRRHAAVWQEALSKRVGLSVQLRTPGTLTGLARGQHRLGWYDLGRAHQVLWRQDENLAPIHPQLALPLASAWRLWLEAGGRWLSLNERANPPEMAQRAYRVATALGDACLIGLGLYHVSMRERAQRLIHWQREPGPAWRYELGYLYQEALQYSLQPSDFAALHDSMPVRWPRLKQLLLDVGALLLAQAGAGTGESLSVLLSTPLARRQAPLWLKDLLAPPEKIPARKAQEYRESLQILSALLPLLLSEAQILPGPVAALLPGAETQSQAHEWRKNWIQRYHHSDLGL